MTNATPIRNPQGSNPLLLYRTLQVRAFGLPNLISLAGGLPNPAKVPISKVEFTCSDGTVLTVDQEYMKKISTYQPSKGLVCVVPFL